MVVVDAGEHGTLKYTVDGKGKVFSMADYAYEVLQYRPRDVLGKDAALLFRPDEREFPELARIFHEARANPGHLYFCPGWLQAKDGSRVNVGATFFWNPVLHVWDISALVVSIIRPSIEQISNVSKIVRLTEVDQKEILSSLEAGHVDEGGLDRMAHEIEQISQQVKEIADAVCRPVSTNHARTRGPYRKPYGLADRDLLIEDSNDAHRKWLKLSAASRPKLDNYLAGQLGLSARQLGLRLVEHRLRLEDLPWSA